MQKHETPSGKNNSFEMCYNENMEWEDITHTKAKKLYKKEKRAEEIRQLSKKKADRRQKKDEKYAMNFQKKYPDLKNRGVKVIFYDKSIEAPIKVFDFGTYNDSTTSYTSYKICLFIIETCRLELDELRYLHPRLKFELYLNGKYHKLSKDGRIMDPENIEMCNWHEPVGSLPPRDESYPKWLERSVIKDWQRFYVKSDYVNVNQYRFRIKVSQQYCGKISCMGVAELVAVKTIKRDDPTEVPENIQKLEQKDYSAEVKKGWRSVLPCDYKENAGVTGSTYADSQINQGQSVSAWLERVLVPNPNYREYGRLEKYWKQFWNNECFLFEGEPFPVEDGNKGPVPPIPQELLALLKPNKEMLEKALNEKIRKATLENQKWKDRFYLKEDLRFG